VLFVDDDEGLHALLRQLFERSQVSFDYDFMSSAGGALSMLNVYCYDAVVLDYKLPDFIAGTAAAEIRAKYDRLPIAYLTNYSDDEMLKEAARLRVDLWPTKWTLMGDQDRLLRLVRELAERLPCDQRYGGAGGGGGLRRDAAAVHLSDPPAATPGGERRRVNPKLDTGYRRRTSDAGARPVLLIPPCLEATLQTPSARRAPQWRYS
jgi:CheY-like chemotaxis protein